MATTEKKYVIPSAMYFAALASCIEVQTFGELPKVLHAVAKYLSENPIVPTEEQSNDLYVWWMSDAKSTNSADMAVEWQRRMFLAPEPEYPADLKKILDSHPEQAVKNDIIAAYKLAQKGEQKWVQTS